MVDVLHNQVSLPERRHCWYHAKKWDANFINHICYRSHQQFTSQITMVLDTSYIHCNVGPRLWAVGFWGKAWTTGDMGWTQLTTVQGRVRARIEPNTHTSNHYVCTVIFFPHQLLHSWHLHQFRHFWHRKPWDGQAMSSPCQLSSQSISGGQRFGGIWWCESIWVRADLRFLGHSQREMWPGSNRFRWSGVALGGGHWFQAINFHHEATFWDTWSLLKTLLSQRTVVSHFWMISEQNNLCCIMFICLFFGDKWSVVGIVFWWLLVKLRQLVCRLLSSIIFFYHLMNHLVN